jgi:hypothetical protein
MVGPFLFREIAGIFTWNGATCMLRCFQPHSCKSYTDNSFTQVPINCIKCLRAPAPKTRLNKHVRCLKLSPFQLMAQKSITLTVESSNDPDITFNREIVLDILYLRVRPALHIFEIDTHFHAASFSSFCVN